MEETEFVCIVPRKVVPLIVVLDPELTGDWWRLHSYQNQAPLIPITNTVCKTSYQC